MWMAYAFGSAFFAGVTANLAKCGIRQTDYTVATAVRTIVMLIFAWLMVFIVGSRHQLPDVEPKTLVFLILSGLASGASWLCYFIALQLGVVNKIVPIDKSSIILTMLPAFIFLGEPIAPLSLLAHILIGAGTFMMIEKKDVQGIKHTDSSWMLYAVDSAVFAGLTSILGKVGIENIESNLGAVIRIVVVLLMS